jgi:hypothetical protein
VTCIFHDLFLSYISKAGTSSRQLVFTESEYEEIAVGSRKLAEQSETRSSEGNKSSACEDFVCRLEELTGEIEEL